MGCAYPPAEREARARRRAAKRRPCPKCGEPCGSWPAVLIYHARCGYRVGLRTRVDLERAAAAVCVEPGTAL